MNWNHLSNCKVIRLNATLFPVSRFETELYQKYHLNPLQIEANTPDEIIPHRTEVIPVWTMQISWDMAFGGGIAPWALFDLGLDMFDQFFKLNIDFGTPLIVHTETSVRVSVQA